MGSRAISETLLLREARVRNFLHQRQIAACKKRLHVEGHIRPTDLIERRGELEE